MNSINLLPGELQGLLKGLPYLLKKGLTYSDKARVILDRASSGEEEIVKKYVRDHGLKTGIALGTIIEIDRALGIFDTSPTHRNSALLMVVLFTNLDKILDYLPSGDPRFGVIFQYYASLVLGETPSSSIIIQHPKLRELEVFARSYASGTSSLVSHGDFESLLRDLVSAVMEQRNSNPTDIDSNNMKEYESYKMELATLRVSKDTKNALFLAARLGISTFNLSIGLGIYDKSSFSSSEKKIVEFITKFNGFLQIVDDFIDRERDQSAQIFTYATSASPEELSMIEEWIKKKGQEISQEFKQDPDIPRILYHGFHMYSFITRFISGGDQHKNPPYKIDFLRRS